MLRRALLFLSLALIVAASAFLLWRQQNSLDVRKRVMTPKDAGVTLSVAAAPVNASYAQQTSSSGVVKPGYYCQSAYSSQARNSCAAAGVEGMQARFFWCTLVDNNKVYNFQRIEDWVTANHAAGLRSIIGLSAKDLRTDTSVLAGTGSCTATSDGSPAWVLTGIYNNDINGVPATALENPPGYYHLNYLDNQAKAEIVRYVSEFSNWLTSFQARNPTAYASIEAIETMFGEQDTGAGVIKPWYPWNDRVMYQCRYGGGVWTSDGSGNGECSLPASTYLSASAANWRDNFSKPLLDQWGGVAPTKPKYMVVSNAFANASIERAQACAGCNSQNLVDYAFNRYGIGAISTGGGVDAGDGNGSDATGYEYTNWFNVLKMRWRNRITGLEAGVMFQDDENGGGCCNTAREAYWNGLQAIDYGATYVFNTAGNLYNLAMSPALNRVRLWHRQTVGNLTGWRYAPMVGIWFRDTDGTYYPDGDNGTFGLPNVVRGQDPCCWWKPNYNFLVYQNNALPSQIVKRLTGYPLPDTFQSWWARRTTTGTPQLKMRIDDEWAMVGQTPFTLAGCARYIVDVTYLDRGTDQWVFLYPNASQQVVEYTVRKTNTGQWITWSRELLDWDLRIRINDADSFWLTDNGDGEDVFHGVQIYATGDCFPPGTIPTPGAPTPTPAALPVCTRAPNTWPTIPVINTPTPTPTRTPTRTPTPTPTP